MACHLIEELKKLGLPYIVAPYEADAQMVYLEREGLVNGIISEDSDLLVFGAKRLLTKLDTHGRCIEINRREFCACREVSLTDFSDTDFRRMAILSGCDYLEGIGNIGLKTAYRMIRKHKTIEKVVRMLQFDGKFKVSENYMAAFRQAELTFLHQRVFCPVKQELVLLSEPTNGLDVEEMCFIGRKIDNDIARGVAIGSLNPMTKEPIILPLSPGKKRRASSVTSSVTGPRSSPSISAFANTGNQQPFGKPINEYFAKRRESAQRIPLGAMDPNCFSVDKQEVAALTQNGLTPPRPQKKAKLYFDESKAPVLSSKGFERSKYFPVTFAAVAASPSTKKPTRLTDSNFMSDDSVEEAMLSLPDIVDWDVHMSNKSAKSTVSVFEDARPTDDCTIVPDSDGVEVPASPADFNSQQTEDVVTSQEDTPITRVSLDRFSYTGALKFAHGLPTPDTSFIESHEKPTTKPSILTPPSSISQRQANQHQTNAPRMSLGELVENTSVTRSERPRSSTKRIRRGMEASIPINPSFVPLPPADLDEVAALNRPQGSEDQIVPDSDGDDDDDKVAEQRGQRAPGGRLDLSRFLCA
ncbi:exodeoxyribonuclease 1 [Sporothrix brasiliensis 5110]|uniref:Exodeoxyribonuclease 1 n=1 Tax=Sporothrix brasiliensis 5110 TaxID=1398154 RepID=A0A0C2J8Z4_9PEZI|nr:exodeoxyribonuclease 1 [Sporothrix brasiliensis 5110]KIH93447.1 exodeoxyribonuclease 1 [Sporothrix brasiliensis 5110]